MNTGDQWQRGLAFVLGLQCCEIISLPRVLWVHSAGPEIGVASCKMKYEHDCFAFGLRKPEHRRFSIYLQSRNFLIRARSFRNRQRLRV
jgi:hypothetical protein